MEINPKFQEYLENTPSAMAKFMDVLYEFHRLQGEIKEVEGDISGPKRFRIGGRVDVESRVNPISREDLDAVARGVAEAHVKERAIEWIKGLIAGIMISL